jgi:hypothetical protein
MSLSMYQASIPVFLRGLDNLSHILAKGAASTETRKIDPLVFAQARLAPDMFPLSRQVQIATDVVKGAGARLAGIEAPVFEDNESNFPELQARVEKTKAFLKTLTAAQIDGSEAKEINLKVGGKALTFKGQDYLFGFVLPNLFFHITTTYSILRHNGVDLGKQDFLGKPE